MIYCYARTSTTTQHVQQQVDYILSKHKVDKVFSDQQSGKTLDRPSFNELIKTVVTGDSIIVQDLSRIGRNTIEVLEFAADMKERGVKLIIDDLDSIDITSTTGKMILTTLSAVNTMMREQMLEKQEIGIRRAQEEGKFIGKQQSQKTIDKCNEALKLINVNGLSKVKAAKAVEIGIATLYRFIKEQN